MKIDSTLADDDTNLFLGAAWFDPIEAGIRDQIRGFIEGLVEEELATALGRGRYQRGSAVSADAEEPPSVVPDAPAAAVGHRHGHRQRQLLGSFGAVELAVPRARLQAEDTTLDPLQAMLRYRELQSVEQLFRSAKSLLATRPIFHKCDATIRGHVFCSFLALVLRKELQDRLTAAGLAPEWAEVLRDLDRLQEIEVEQDDKRFVLRTPTTGCAGKLFQTLGVALPPNIRDATPPAAATVAESSQM